MRRPRTLAVGAIAALMALGAVASASARIDGGGKKITVAFIPPVLANPAIQAMNNGFKNQAKKLGFTALTLGGEFSPQAQIVAMNAGIQRKVDAIVIWPLDPKGIRPSFDRARKAGIKLFTIWSPNLRGVTANFQYAEFAAASKIARLAATEVKRRGQECKVGIIQGLPIVTILDVRNRGLEAGAKAAGCEILERQVNQTDSADGARPIVDAWETKWGSQMTAILAYNDPSALGAVSAFSPDELPVIVGMNADPAAVKALKAGTMLATTTIPNPEVGNAFAYAAYQLLVNKRTVPAQLNGPVDVLTKANVDKYVPWNIRNRSSMNVSFVNRGGAWFIRTIPDYSIR